MNHTRRFLFFFVIAVVVACVAVWAFQNFMYTLGQSSAEVTQTDLTDLQDKELSAYLDMNRLLTTLSTTVLGAIGFLLNTRKAHNPFLLWLGLASALCVGVSIYCGYEAHEDILWMLEGHFFDLNNPQMLWARVTAFFSFLLGAALFLAFVGVTFLNVPSKEVPS